MKRHPLVTVLLVLAAAVFSHPAAVQAKKIFPYFVNKTTLENKLDVIIIEMPEFKDVLSFNMMVLTGARNETEKGRTGFAHLFEHIMFRHKYGDMINGYDMAINKLGAHNNAWTSYDVTFYHPLTFTSNLEAVRRSTGEIVPGLLELEASRFTSLAYDEKIFKMETGAVLGEYRNNAANPSLAMSEKQLGLAFPKHPYGHTVMGYYDDVVDMPNHYDYAVWFYDTYYRPSNCVLVIAGDVKKDEILPKVQQAFSAWEPGEIPVIDVEDPPQQEELRGHVAWKADVPPRVWVGYKGAGYTTGSKPTAVGQILSELLTSRSAPLYKKLRFEKKTVNSLYLSVPDSFDPRLVSCYTQLFADQYEEKGNEYIEEVTDDVIQGMEELKTFSYQSDAADILETVKSKVKYDLLAGLNSPANVAETFAWYYRFERDPEVIDQLVQSILELSPADIDAFARKYFVENNRVIITMAPKEH